MLDQLSPDHKQRIFLALNINTDHIAFKTEINFKKEEDA